LGTLGSQNDPHAEESTEGEPAAAFILWLETLRDVPGLDPGSPHFLRAIGSAKPRRG